MGGGGRWGSGGGVGSRGGAAERGGGAEVDTAYTGELLLLMWGDCGGSGGVKLG